MSLYAEAAAVITTQRETKQAELDRAAIAWRQAHIEALRRDLRDNSDSPAAPLRNLLAETISVGRDKDGYPAYNIPDAVCTMLLAAYEAGLLQANEYGQFDMGGISLAKDLRVVAVAHPAQDDDYRSWVAAKNYRIAQKTSPV